MTYLETCDKTDDDENDICIIYHIPTNTYIKAFPNNYDMANEFLTDICIKTNNFKQRVHDEAVRLQIENKSDKLNLKAACRNIIKTIKTEYIIYFSMIDAVNKEELDGAAFDCACSYASFEFDSLKTIRNDNSENEYLQMRSADNLWLSENFGAHLANSLIDQWGVN